MTSHHFKDETGNRYGKLVVIRQSGYNSAGAVIWHCECDCGKTSETQGNNLRNGNTKTCGCSKLENEGHYRNREKRLFNYRTKQNRTTSA